MRYTLLLIIAAIHTSFGQSVKDELVKINHAYQKKSNLFMQIEYNAYQGDSKTSIESKKGLIAKTPSSLYQKLDETETVAQDSLQVVVDHARKIMVLTVKAASSTDLLSLGPAIEKTLSKCSKINEVKDKGFKGYEMFVEDDGYTKIYFSYSPKDYMLHKIVFFYTSMQIDGQNLENIRVEMKYTYERSDMNNKKLYDFVKRINDRYESMDRFASYQFLDYTSITGKVKTDSIKK